jgi:hypothetical protein
VSLAEQLVGRRLEKPTLASLIQSPFGQDRTADGMRLGGDPSQMSPQMKSGADWAKYGRATAAGFTSGAISLAGDATRGVGAVTGSARVRKAGERIIANGRKLEEGYLRSEGGDRIAASGMGLGRVGFAGATILAPMGIGMSMARAGLAARVATGIGSSMPMTLAGAAASATPGGAAGVVATDAILNVVGEGLPGALKRARGAYTGMSREAQAYARFSAATLAPAAVGGAAGAMTADKGERGERALLGAGAGAYAGMMGLGLQMRFGGQAAGLASRGLGRSAAQAASSVARFAGDEHGHLRFPTTRTATREYAEAHRAEKLTRAQHAEEAPIRNWVWKPVELVREQLGASAAASHVEEFGRFQLEMVERATKGQITTRELLTANAVTQASIQRQAMTVPSLISRGNFPIPAGYADSTIRPEGAMAELLMHPVGQRYLDHAEQGIVDIGGVEQMVDWMRPFGKDQTREKEIARYAAQYGSTPGARVQGRPPHPPDRERDPGGAAILDPCCALYNSAVLENYLGNQAEARTLVQMAADEIPGIATAKRGFLPQFLGYGGSPTLDARQIMLHTGLPATDVEEAMTSRMKEAAVARLTRRQDALGIEMPRRCGRSTRAWCITPVGRRRPVGAL